MNFFLDIWLSAYIDVCNVSTHTRAALSPIPAAVLRLPGFQSWGLSCHETLPEHNYVHLALTPTFSPRCSAGNSAIENVCIMSVRCQWNVVTWDVAEMSMRCQWNVCDAFVRCQSDVSEMSARCRGDVSEMWLRRQWDVSKVSVRCDWDVSETSGRCQ